MYEHFRGEHCLVGGSGWWKYEFCYGKKVDQFHVNEQTVSWKIEIPQILDILKKHDSKFLNP